jgi:hypothetical protein
MPLKSTIVVLCVTSVAYAQAPPATSDRSADAEQIARNIAAWKILGVTGDPDTHQGYLTR